MTPLVIFELDGNIPPKKNRPRIFQRGASFIRLPSKAHEKWHQGAGYQINLQKSNSPVALPIKKCDYIEVHLYYGTKIPKDNTNTVESVHDLLVDCGVLADDNWQITGETRQIPHYRKDQPGCKIIIKVSDQEKDSIAGQGTEGNKGSGA